jgi:hypothetical protein
MLQAGKLLFRLEFYIVSAFKKNEHQESSGDIEQPVLMADSFTAI